jgi:hypothetical protein
MLLPLRQQQQCIQQLMLWVGVAMTHKRGATCGNTAAHCSRRSSSHAGMGCVR